MAVLTEDSQQRVEEHLVETGILLPAQLADLKNSAKEAGRPFFAFMLEHGDINEEQLTEAIA